MLRFSIRFGSFFWHGILAGFARFIVDTFGFLLQFAWNSFRLFCYHSIEIILWIFSFHRFAHNVFLYIDDASKYQNNIATEIMLQPVWCK